MALDASIGLVLHQVSLTYKQESFGTLFIIDLLETLSITYLCFW